MEVKTKLEFNSQFEIFSPSLPSNPLATPPEIIPKIQPDIVRKRFFKTDYYIKSGIPSKLRNAYLITHDDEVFHMNFKSISKELFEKYLDAWEKMTGFKKAISQEKALSICDSSYLDDAELAYFYWIRKRKNLGFALSREYWHGDDTTDQNLKRTFTKKSKMKLRSNTRTLEKRQKMQVLLEELMEICEILKLYLKQEIVKLKIIKIKIEEFEIRKSGLLREEVLNAEELKDVNSSKLILHDFDFQKDIFSENPRKYIANPFLKLEYHQGNNK